jgi:hypothetical protein
MLTVLIYVYWYAAQYSYQMMSRSNITSATGGAGSEILKISKG